MDFVQRYLDGKDKHDKIIHRAFYSDIELQDASQSTFEHFIMSLFVDDMTRKGLRGTGEVDVESILENIMILFRHLQERDVFGKYYKQRLAQRLLSNNVWEDAERSLILKLKNECGDQFTADLEVMLADMKISDDTMQGFYADIKRKRDFQDFLQYIPYDRARFPNLTLAQLEDGPTLAVRVLTTGSWPTQLTTPCNLPPEILTQCDKFKKYYNLRNRKGPRRLDWLTDKGSADIKATFGEGKEYELNVSTYQMCVLMLFNNRDGLSYKEIEQATKIPTLDLKQCLHSLACVKGENVLRKELMSEEDVGEDDKFFFNDKFASKNYKVKIETLVESEPEIHETRQRVEEYGKPQIEAAIVRIMKSRRVLRLDNIRVEVEKVLRSRFRLNPVVIEQRIESLIEREYLEWDEDDRNLCRYLP